MPILLFNTSKTDRYICQLVLASGMKCEFLATEDENTPILIYRHREFSGKEEIEHYVEGWKATRRKLATVSE
jgi:hypothetical protein